MHAFLTRNSYLIENTGKKKDKLNFGDYEAGIVSQFSRLVSFDFPGYSTRSASSHFEVRLIDD